MMLIETIFLELRESVTLAVIDVGQRGTEDLEKGLLDKTQSLEICIPQIEVLSKDNRKAFNPFEFFFSDLALSQDNGSL